MTSRKLISETRTLIKELLHCQTKEVIFTPSATFALNMIIQGMIYSGAKNIYISPFEHNAVTRVLHHFEKQNMIVVYQLNFEKFDFNFERIKYQFEEIKPDLVICTHASNVTGIILPVAELCNLSKNFGATTVIDMAQTCGLVDLDCGNQNIDFAVFAGHKTLYGPTGIGGFVMNQNIVLPPVIFGGTGVDSINPEMPSSIPEKYEMGTQNILGIAGLNASLKWILNIGIEILYNKEIENRNRLIELLNNFDFVKPVGIYDSSSYVGIVSVLIEGISSDTAENIFSEQRIALRGGLQCSPFAHKFLGTTPAGTVRFSTSYFTSEEDFLHLEKVLKYLEEEM
jgi:cysteine desulfurase family protein